MNLLYLPTLIALAIKYGPEISTAIAAVRQYSPMMIAIVKALAPIVQKEVGNMQSAAVDEITAATHQVLVSIGHPGLSDDEREVLANRLSQMS